MKRNIIMRNFSWMKLQKQPLKVLYTCMRLLILNWFGQKNPSELLINLLKYFRFYLRIRRDIWISVHSAYSQYTRNFIQCIICLCAISFRVLSDYVKFYSAYSQHTRNEDEKCMTNLAFYPSTRSFFPRIIQLRRISFPVLSDYVRFHSAYYPYKLSFIIVTFKNFVF